QIVNPKFTLRKDVDLRAIRNKQTVLQYKICPDDLAINKNPGECALDLIMHEYTKKHPKYTRQRLLEDLKETALPEEAGFLAEGVTVRHMKAWATLKKKTTFIAVSPMGDAFDWVIDSESSSVVITAYVNNGHVYGITDPELKAKISKTKKLIFTQLEFNRGLL